MFGRAGIGEASRGGIVAVLTGLPDEAWIHRVAFGRSARFPTRLVVRMNSCYEAAILFPRLARSTMGWFR